MTAPISLQEDYWDTFTIQDNDLEYLYNHLLEIETPQTPQELVRELLTERIRQVKDELRSQQRSGAAVFAPKNHYKEGQELVFPALQWQKGEVVSLRPGNNPDLGDFEVIEVAFQNGETREYAAGLEEHKLNQPIEVRLDDPNLDVDTVMRRYGDKFSQQISDILEENPDLVRIAGRWFPRALLVDVNIGYLNLAEALLDMEGGGPLATKAILDQIELPTDVNVKLTEFSLNLAMQEDGRFDEVGPAGEVLWFLRRLEPESVQNVPTYLRYNPVPYDRDEIEDLLAGFDHMVLDELEPPEEQSEGAGEEETAKTTISLIYPHWRAGTLPLTGPLLKIFPTAIESPRVQFTFVDTDSGEHFSGWVVRPHHYIFGLREWYEDKGLIPGSLIQISKGEEPGEIMLHIGKKRSSREWIRTVLVGTDEAVVFAMLKQLITAPYEERMAISVPDVEALDRIWEQNVKRRVPLNQTVLNVMRELAKLTPQGHVHAQELYAAVNIVRRCPPGPILNVLNTQPWAMHPGDLYFRLDPELQEGPGYE